MSDAINIGALADFESRRIEGYVGGFGPVAVPLFSHIDGNLWVGGCPVESAPKEFQFIVDLYTHGAYHVHGHQIATSARLMDSAEMPDVKVLHALADHVNQCRAIGPTLVHCQAGLNRSGLIAALALMKAGLSSKGAIDLLRSKRSDAVLCNAAFHMWLRKQDAPGVAT